MDAQTLLEAEPVVLPPPVVIARNVGYGVPWGLQRFIQKRVELKQGVNVLFLEAVSDLPLLVERYQTRSVAKAGLWSSIVYARRLNNIRYVNKFMEAVNENLQMGGVFIGSVETAEQRRERLYERYPRRMALALYTVDYLLRRVWPKLPYAKKIYFALTRGKHRVISEMEMYGRLYSCGFRLLEVCRLKNRLYFAAEKTGRPAYNLHATYGPVITLRRQGKNKMINVYKLRTMYPYSEYLQQYIYEHNGLESGGKMKNDPRVNAVGRFLRKYWIDELPMLVNLLRGDLKLFGVRPISLQYLDLYPEDFQEYRKKFKPGLIPPFYVDLPQTLEEIVASEKKYLQAYEKAPWRTDLQYLSKALYHIFVKKIRSH